MKLAVAAVSVPHLIATAYRLWLVQGEVDPDVFRGFGVSSAVGSLVGAYVGLFAQADWLALLLAALLLFVGVGGLTGWTQRMRFRGDLRYLAGLLSGVFGGLVGNQGGVRSAALLGFDLSKGAFVATATASGVIVDLVRMPVYGVAYGKELLGHWPVVLVAVAGCLAGTLLGRSVLARVPQGAFQRVVCWVLVATALFVLGRYVSSS
jgi:uncharacterized membrane protein YfcA